MNIVEELAKLQQLRAEGALTDEEFAQAKRKLLQDDTSHTVPTAAQTIKLSLKDGLDEIVDEESTLGGAANRYVSFQYTSLIVGAILFVVVAIIMFTVFSNFSNGMQHGVNNFPGGPFGH
ncbi:MAG TPA: SHOCT domain-containing protein [Armatimonadota bacterium]